MCVYVRRPSYSGCGFVAVQCGCCPWAKHRPLVFPFGTISLLPLVLDRVCVCLSLLFALYLTIIFCFAVPEAYVESALHIFYVLRTTEEPFRMIESTSTMLIQMKML